MMTPLSEPGEVKVERECGKNRNYDLLYAIILIRILSGYVPVLRSWRAAIRVAFGRVAHSLATVMNNPPGFFVGTGMPDPGWWEALWPDPAQVLSAVGVTAGASVIDLCSGDGWFTLQIAKVVHHVFAIDIDPKLVATARIRLAEAGITNCTFITADAYDIARVVPYPVDHVFLANAFHGVPDRLRLSRAVKSVLKPGGIFAIVSWHARPRDETPVLGHPRGPATELRMTPQTTIADVEPAGFRLRDIVEVSPYHYGAVFVASPS